MQRQLHFEWCLIENRVKLSTTCVLKGHSVKGCGYKRLLNVRLLLIY